MSDFSEVYRFFFRAHAALWPNSEVEHHCEPDCQCWYAKIRETQRHERMMKRALVQDRDEREEA